MKFFIAILSLISLNAFSITHEHPTCCSMIHDCQSQAGPSPDCSSNCDVRHANRVVVIDSEIIKQNLNLKDSNDKLKVQIDRKKDAETNTPLITKTIAELQDKSLLISENFKHKNEKHEKFKNKDAITNKAEIAKIIHDNYFDKNLFYKIAIMLEQKDKNLLIPLNTFLAKSLNLDHEILFGINEKIKSGKIKEVDFNDVLEANDRENETAVKQISYDISKTTDAQIATDTDLKRYQIELANKDKNIADIQSLISNYQNQTANLSKLLTDLSNLKTYHTAFRDVNCKLKYVAIRNYKKICGINILQNYTCKDTRPDLIDSDT